MSDLAAKLREVLIAEGASPSLADELTAQHTPTFVKAIAREHGENEAQRLLPLIGAVKAAERLGVCRKTIYNRARRKCNSGRPIAQTPA